MKDEDKMTSEEIIKKSFTTDFDDTIAKYTLLIKGKKVKK